VFKISIGLRKATNNMLPVLISEKNWIVEMAMGWRGDKWVVGCAYTSSSISNRPVTQTDISVTDLCRSSYARFLENPDSYLTFRGPCIVIYSYNKTKEMH